MLSAGVGIALVVVGALWFWARSSRRDALGMTVCAGLYRGATSLADTIRIDGQLPLARTRGELNPMTCGALRSAYPGDVVPAKP